MSEIYTKSMTVKMPDQSVWSVPVWIIADHRANHYKHEFGGDLVRSREEDTLPLFEIDECEIVDWAANNMNWTDVKSKAVMIRQDECDYQEGWITGDKNIID